MANKRAVVYGAGSIGRGFIARLLYESGYEITFIDITAPLIQALNTEKEYPVRLLSMEGQRDVIIKNFFVINGKDEDAAVNAIAGTDIMVTALGTRVLPLIACVIAKGIKKRLGQGKPLDIIICENLINSDQVLEELVKNEFKKLNVNSRTIKLFAKHTGFIRASIGCMAPVQTDKMKDGNQLRICTEDYSIMPVDKKAFKGEVPSIMGMEAQDNFNFSIEKKLFIHNMGHSSCAYLGLYKGYEYIYKSIQDGDIFLTCENAMLECAASLAQKHNIPIKDIYLHTQDLLKRFSNKLLWDTCQRVGSDITRKLSPGDRFMGAIRCCEGMNIKPFYITKGAAAALYCYIKENSLSQTEKQARKIMGELCKLKKNTESHELMLCAYLTLVKTISG